VDSTPGAAGLGAKVFFVWGSCCFFCVLFVYFFIYETKGLTLEQVDSLYAEVGNAWHSNGWKPQVTFVEERRKSVMSAMAEAHMEKCDNVVKAEETVSA
jgi:MFS transporter, SP family, sugar:H+ symporter